MSGLAATLREAERGTKVRLTLEDGREVSGALDGVHDDTVDLDEGKRRIELRRVKRLRLELSSAPKRRLWKRSD